MKFIALLCLMLASYGFSAEKSYKIKRGDYNKVTWLATGNPGFLEIDGRGGWVAGDLSDDGGMFSGQFSVEMDKFKTGQDLRDDHMKNKYLEVKKYPTATFVLDPVKSGKSFDVKGKLTLHGVTKDITGQATMKKQGGSDVVTVTTTIKLTDFKIDVPSWLGVTVAENVKITTILSY